MATSDVAALRAALTFHAPFDGSADAARGAGDRTLYHAPDLKRRSQARAGLPPAGTVQLAADGRFGGALRFAQSKSPVVFYRADQNVPYRPENWSGTVSLWLSTDPAGELPDGFCDPVQITPRSWDDAAFFVEFEKRAGSIPFRLGVYADKTVWNPANRRFADVPPSERPLVTVEHPPFAAGRWTHVLFTFERFNTGRQEGTATLYLDGVARGTLSGREQRFTWDLQDTAIVLGLSYVGLLDDLAIFSRALTPGEIQALHRLEHGVRSLHATR